MILRYAVYLDDTLVRHVYVDARLSLIAAHRFICTEYDLPERAVIVVEEVV